MIGSLEDIASSLSAVQTRGYGRLQLAACVAHSREFLSSGGDHVADAVLREAHVAFILPQSKQLL